jgi:hypothetical protein
VKPPFEWWNGAKRHGGYVRARVRQEGPAGGRSSDQFDLLQNFVRDDVEQVLRKPPDRRRLTKQLVRIQIRLAVIAIAVIEMAIQHQHA